MKRIKGILLPVVIFAALWAISAYVGPETWHAWTPYMLIGLALFVYAHFSVKFDHIEMDLDMIEEALDRIEPNYHHQVGRFRYGRSRPDIPNPRADVETD